MRPVFWGVGGDGRVGPGIAAGVGDGVEVVGKKRLDKGEGT